MNTVRSMLTRLSTVFFFLGIYSLLYIPLIVLVIFSFNDAALPAPWHGFSLKWYYELASSIDLWKAFFNSLIVSSCATFLSVIMSIALIFYGTQREQHHTEQLLRLFYGNLLVPEVVLGVGLLSLFTMLSVPLGLITLIIAYTVVGLGYAMPIVYTRFLELDYRVTEASLDLGASQVQTFFKITLPLLRPALVAAGLLVFIISFDDFVISYFCAGSSVQTLSLYIVSMLRSGVSPVVSALSTGLLALSSLILGIYVALRIRARGTVP
jgi:spermidine/putrescine transport system permease protein